MSESSSCVEAEKTSSKKSTKVQQTLELCVSEEKEGLLPSGDNGYDQFEVHCLPAEIEDEILVPWEEDFDANLQDMFKELEDEELLPLLYGNDCHTSPPVPNVNQELECMVEEVGYDNRSNVISTKKARELEFQDVQCHFDKPIAEAAKALRVGRTGLKSRCRKLGIKTWPHRSIKSLDFLIRNAKELEIEEDLEFLVEQKRKVREQPNTNLSERIRKIQRKTYEKRSTLVDREGNING